jgi:fructose-1,6-bisphosphatase/inositol monophosphatase family enzyme
MTAQRAATPRGALPPALAAADADGRLAAALCAVRGAGAALLCVRGATGKGVEVGDQLKTAVDRAAEGWVLGYLEGAFPSDAFLAEERFEAEASEPEALARIRQNGAFWTVDALDGTRSFIDGFDGFCVQVAYLRDGAPVVAAIDEPAAGLTWAAIAGAGAYLLDRNATASPAPPTPWTRVTPRSLPDWPSAPRFIDSTPPRGPVGRVMAHRNGQFVECGSIGVKAVRIARGDADVFAKDLRFKLWDVAPADLVLREAESRLGTWDGAPIPYTGTQVALRGLLAAPADLFDKVVDDLAAR